MRCEFSESEEQLYLFMASSIFISHFLYPFLNLKEYDFQVFHHPLLIVVLSSLILPRCKLKNTSLL